MRVMHQLTWLHLAVFSTLSLYVQCTPNEDSRLETPTLDVRDDTANYVIYPKDPLNKDQATAIDNLLKGLVSDQSKIYVSNTVIATLFFSAPLTSSNADQVKSNSNVGAIVQECKSGCGDPTGGDDPDNEKRSYDEAPHEKRSRLTRRDDGTVNSHKVEPEMAFISWPDQTTLGDDFVYDKSAGSGQTVYFVDTGAGLDNTAEFSKFVSANKRYLQARGGPPSDELENDVAKHGTSVLAKIAGWKHGVAKRSKPVIVRVSQKGDPGAWLDGIRQVYDDWLPTYNANPRTATAIINLSWGFSDQGLMQSGYEELAREIWKERLALVLNECIGIGLLPVMPSGNAPGNLPVNQWPQLHLYPSNGNPPVITHALIVGGVSTDGNLSPRSVVDPPNTPRTIKLYAPNKDIMVPEPTGQDFRLAAGTSLSAATISGLGTYFLGLSSLSGVLSNDDPVQRVIQLRNQLEVGSSVARGNNDPQLSSIWNFADPRTCPPGAQPPGFTNGDEVPCADTSSTNGNTVLAIPNCLIETVPPMTSVGLNAPSTLCSCQGGEIAGINSGTVSGTTYSWCATGGLPSGVPAQATSTGTPLPPAPTTTPAPSSVPLESQCIHEFTDPTTSIAICSTSTSKNDLSTPLPDGYWTCLPAGLIVCFCKVAGQAEPCEPANQLAAGNRRHLIEAGPEPTKAPSMRQMGLRDLLGNF